VNREEKVELVKECIESRDSLFNSFGELEKLVGTFSESSPLWNSMCSMDNALQKSVSLNIGDVEMLNGMTWLNWFIYDNDCGKKGYTASVNAGKERSIKTIEDLLDLIDEDNRFNAINE